MSDKNTQAEAPAPTDCESCCGTGSGGMGIGCTDCLGTGRDSRAWTDLNEIRPSVDADDLDAWVCTDCGGEGRVTVYHDVSHQLGTDSLPFWETCPTCDGLKFCGPDAEKRSEIAKATGGKP